MKKPVFYGSRGRALCAAVAGLFLASSIPGHAQGINLAECKGLWFSTSEDFLSRGPDLPGGPIVSDGDLRHEVLSAFPEDDCGVRVVDSLDQLDRTFEKCLNDVGLEHPYMWDEIIDEYR